MDEEIALLYTVFAAREYTPPPDPPPALPALLAEGAVLRIAVGKTTAYAIGGPGYRRLYRHLFGGI
jgi:hypothetical protein